MTLLLWLTKVCRIASGVGWSFWGGSTQTWRSSSSEKLGFSSYWGQVRSSLYLDQMSWSFWISSAHTSSLIQVVCFVVNCDQGCWMLLESSDDCTLQATSGERTHNSARWWGPQRTKVCKCGHCVKSLLGFKAMLDRNMSSASKNVAEWCHTSHSFESKIIYSKICWKNIIQGSLWVFYHLLCTVSCGCRLSSLVIRFRFTVFAKALRNTQVRGTSVLSTYGTRPAYLSAHGIFATQNSAVTGHWMALKHTEYHDISCKTPFPSSAQSLYMLWLLTLGVVPKLRHSPANFAGLDASQHYLSAAAPVCNTLFRSKIVLWLCKSRNVQSASVSLDSDMIWLFGVFLVPCLHRVKGIKLRMDLTQLDKLSLAFQSDILDDSLQRLPMNTNFWRDSYQHHKNLVLTILCSYALTRPKEV